MMQARKVGIFLAVLLIVFSIGGVVFIIHHNNKQRFRHDRFINIECVCRLKEIGVAFWSYESDMGYFPDKLETLAQKNYIKQSGLTCPANDSLAIGYDYAGIKDKNGSFPIIMDKKGNHPGAINVLMSDGIVLTVPDDMLAQAISEYMNMDKESTYVPYQGYPPKY